MRRWFRRKGKDNDQDDENGAAPLGEEIESSPEAAGEEVSAELGPEAPEAASHQTEIEPLPEERGGLFRRWRREAQPEEEAPPALEEAATESPAAPGEPVPAPLPEPPPPPEPETAPVIPAAPEPELDAAPPEVWQEATRPFHRKPRTWRRPGRFPKTRCGGGCFAACGNG